MTWWLPMPVCFLCGLIKGTGATQLGGKNVWECIKTHFYSRNHLHYVCRWTQLTVQVKAKSRCFPKQQLPFTGLSDDWQQKSPRPLSPSILKGKENERPISTWFHLGQKATFFSCHTQYYEWLSCPPHSVQLRYMKYGSRCPLNTPTQFPTSPLLFSTRSSATCYCFLPFPTSRFKPPGGTIADVIHLAWSGTPAQLWICNFSLIVHWNAWQSGVVAPACNGSTQKAKTRLLLVCS